MFQQLRAERGERGFTLVELLVVIAILGVLAGVVVFSVAGITNNSQTAACATEKSILATAEEAYQAQPGNTGKYVSQDAGAGAAVGLVTAKLLQSSPTWYKAVAAGTAPNMTYTVSKDTTNGLGGAANVCP